MVSAEGEFPKVGNDPIYASEVNSFQLGTGNGSDGAFSESAGTTNLTQGVIYNYTSFLLDTNATLSAASTSTEPIIILVQDNCTINGTITLKGKGCVGGTQSLQGEGYGTNIASGGAYAGGKRCEYSNFQHKFFGPITNGTGAGGANQGSGGGGGGSSSLANGSAGGAGGAGGGTGQGGAGGATIIIICGGDLTFGASSSIDVSGDDGEDNSASRGAGGGGSGDVVLLYKGSLTDGGITITKAGGAGIVSTANGGDGADGNEVILPFSDIKFGGFLFNS